MAVLLPENSRRWRGLQLIVWVVCCHIAGSTLIGCEPSDDTSVFCGHPSTSLGAVVVFRPVSSEYLSDVGSCDWRQEWSIAQGAATVLEATESLCWQQSHPGAWVRHLMIPGQDALSIRLRVLDDSGTVRYAAETQVEVFGGAQLQLNWTVDERDWADLSEWNTPPPRVERFSGAGAEPGDGVPPLWLWITYFNPVTRAGFLGSSSYCTVPGSVVLRSSDGILLEDVRELLTTSCTEDIEAFECTDSADVPAETGKCQRVRVVLRDSEGSVAAYYQAGLLLEDGLLDGVSYELDCFY